MKAREPTKITLKLIVTHRSSGLQWSHGLSTVETILRISATDKVTYGFNGATVFQPWKLRDVPQLILPYAKLQWSHGLSTVETSGNESGDKPDPGASMEPRSFNRGNCVAVLVITANMNASMEPRSFNRGNLRSENRPD